MKIIMVKDYQNFKKDTVVEVKDGFGKNFLIRNNYALPFNLQTKNQLEKRRKENEALEAEITKKALLVKEKFEKMELVFYLKMNKDRAIHSISTKMINSKMAELGFDLPKHAVPHISIRKLGQFPIEVKLSKHVTAVLKIKVEAQ